MNRDKEIWAMALWVERHHGENGLRFIGQHIDRLKADGDLDREIFWWAVAEKLQSLRDPGNPRN